MAAAVGAALGVPLDPATGSPPAAARRPRAPRSSAGRTDRERATVYLEALFTGAGVPADAHGRGRAVPAAAARASAISGAASPPAPARRSTGLRAAGLRLGVVSNSDGRVEEALEAAGAPRLFRRGARLRAGRRGEARSRYLPCRARRPRRGPGGGALRRRPVRGGRGRRAGRGDGGRPARAGRRRARTRLPARSTRSARWPTTCSQGDLTTRS